MLSIIFVPLSIAIIPDWQLIPKLTETFHELDLGSTEMPVFAEKPVVFNEPLITIHLSVYILNKLYFTNF